MKKEYGTMYDFVTYLGIQTWCSSLHYTHFYFSTILFFFKGTFKEQRNYALLAAVFILPISCSGGWEYCAVRMLYSPWDQFLIVALLGPATQVLWYIAKFHQSLIVCRNITGPNLKETLFCKSFTSYLPCSGMVVFFFSCGGKMIKLLGNGYQLMVELESVPRAITEWMRTNKLPQNPVHKKWEFHWWILHLGEDSTGANSLPLNE